MLSLQKNIARRLTNMSNVRNAKIAFMRHAQILMKLESDHGSWYCSGCKADCGLCSGAVLYGHKAVHCDKCEIWIHNVVFMIIR